MIDRVGKGYGSFHALYRDDVARTHSTGLQDTGHYTRFVAFLFAITFDHSRKKPFVHFMQLVKNVDALFPLKSANCHC